MNLQQQEQFYQMMTLYKERRSRAASSSSATEDKRITEVVNGIITTRPAKRIEYLSSTEQNSKEPIVIDLQSKAAAASVPVVNKLQEIIKFQKSNGRL